MKPSYVFLAFFLWMAWMGYGVYDFYNSSESELGQLHASLDALKQTVVDKEKQVKESQEFYRTLDLKRGELRKLNEKLLTMKATLSETVDLPVFMKLLITEAQRIGLQITSITPQAKAKATYYTEQPVELSFSGVFIQLIAYLDRLSQSSRIIRVEDIALRPLGSSNANAKKGGSRFMEMTGTIRVKTFYYLVTKDDELAQNPGVADTTPKPGGAK